MDINLDQKSLEMCLKEINDIGGTVYKNICTGQETYVVWGTLGWFSLVGVGLLFLAFLAWMTFALYGIIHTASK